MASLVARASQSTVGSLFATQARQFPGRIALQQDHRRVTYGELASPRHAERLLALGLETRQIQLGGDYEAFLHDVGSAPLPDIVEPEDALLILYTSGTTGLPKGAVISHRAEIVRNMVIRAEGGITPEDTFPAWSPLYHMGAADPSLVIYSAEIERVLIHFIALEEFARSASGKNQRHELEKRL